MRMQSSRQVLLDRDVAPPRPKEALRPGTVALCHMRAWFSMATHPEGGEELLDQIVLFVVQVASPRLAMPIVRRSASRSWSNCGRPMFRASRTRSATMSIARSSVEPLPVGRVRRAVEDLGATLRAGGQLLARDPLDTTGRAISGCPGRPRSG